MPSAADRRYHQPDARALRRVIGVHWSLERPIQGRRGLYLPAIPVVQRAAVVPGAVTADPIPAIATVAAHAEAGVVIRVAAQIAGVLGHAGRRRRGRRRRRDTYALARR